MAMTVTETAAGETGVSTSRNPAAWVSALAFAVSSIWFALISAGVTQGAAPEASPGAPLEVMLERQYGWFASTLTQERLVTGIAIAGFASLIVAVWNMRERFEDARPSVTAGALLVSLGSAVWIVGNVIQLGGHRAVGAMATHNNPIETANAINFTIDMIDDATEFAAFAMLGAGMAGFAIAAWRTVGSSQAWSRYTVAFAVALAALGVSHGAEDGDATDLLLVTVGVILTPAWLLWSERLGRESRVG